MLLTKIHALQINFLKCAYNAALLTESGWLVHCWVYNLDLKCVLQTCCDAAAGVVCDSVCWQLKCILLHKPLSNGKQRLSLFWKVIYKCLTVVTAGSGCILIPILFKIISWINLTRRLVSFRVLMIQQQLL